MDKGLRQKQVGNIIGVDECTITNWELGRTKPQIHHIPKVIKFLGYVPFESPNDPIGRLRHLKLVNGLSYDELGKLMARDPEQLTDWLSGRVKPCVRNIRRINKFLSSV